jgi:hypothetical protein
MLKTKPITHPTANKSVAVPGSYSGRWNPANGGDVITFFVAPGGRNLLNVHVPYAYVSCVPPQRERWLLPGNHPDRAY